MLMITVKPTSPPSMAVEVDGSIAEIWKAPTGTKSRIDTVLVHFDGAVDVRRGDIGQLLDLPRGLKRRVVATVEVKPNASCITHEDITMVRLTVVTTDKRGVDVTK